MRDRASLDHVLSAVNDYSIADATLEATLQRVAVLATLAVQPARFVGITTVVDGRQGTFVFDHPTAPEIDGAQYVLGDGPSLDACRTGRANVIDSTLAERRWPEFCRTAADRGVLSCVALPMTAGMRTVGAMALYAERQNAFTTDDLDAGKVLAVSVAFLLANLQAYGLVRTLADDMTAAAESRAVIEQAKGIIMGSRRVGADEAFGLLVAQSQHENVKVRDIAQQLVATYGQRS